jgi:hypothetical protein
MAVKWYEDQRLDRRVNELTTDHWIAGGQSHNDWIAESTS